MKKTAFCILLCIFSAMLLFCRTSSEQALEEIYERMTPEQRVGQMFFLAFDGREITPLMREWIENRLIGGIALFAKNAVNASQLITLTQGLQALALQQQPAIPLFLATDHEPGGFMAIRLGRTFSGQRSIYKSEGQEGILRVYRALSEDLKQWGFNMNLAPVLDVARSGGESVFDYRCISDDPAVVAETGAAIIRASLEAGIIPVAKHFPGHGDTTVDSHHQLPVIKKSMEDFNTTELVPFRAAIQAGVPAIMPAHILFSEIDPDYPATLSTEHLTGLLRDELDFEGITISDDLAMGAIKDRYDFIEACKKSILAGMDMLLITRRFADMPALEEVHRILAEWEKNDPEARVRIKESVLRILRIKQQHLAL